MFYILNLQMIFGYADQVKLLYHLYSMKYNEYGGVLFSQQTIILEKA